MSHLAVAYCSALIFAATSASAASTDGYNYRYLEKLAIINKAPTNRINAPRTELRFTIRKPLSRMKTLYCGVLHPTAAPTTEVYFTAVFDWDNPDDSVKLIADTSYDGNEAKFCKKLDMSMP